MSHIYHPCCKNCGAPHLPELPCPSVYELPSTGSVSFCTSLAAPDLACPLEQRPPASGGSFPCPGARDFWQSVHTTDLLERERRMKTSRAIIGALFVGLGRALLDERRDVVGNLHAIFSPLSAHGVPSVPSDDDESEDEDELAPSLSGLKIDPAPAAGVGVPGVPAPGIKCAICLERPIDCVLLECGHQATCVTCTQGLKPACPICRAPIARVVRTFVA
jgi:Zinc finger, C3HC4 type (RING finger)